MENIISTDHQDQSRRFWFYIKSRKQESTGIVTLKDKDRLLCSDTPTKATILNEQFQSLYIREVMSSIQDMVPSKFLIMGNIRVSQSGVFKLLRGLRPFQSHRARRNPCFHTQRSILRTGTLSYSALPEFARHWDHPR